MRFKFLVLLASLFFSGTVFADSVDIRRREEWNVKLRQNVSWIWNNEKGGPPPKEQEFNGRDIGNGILAHVFMNQIPETGFVSARMENMSNGDACIFTGKRVLNRASGIVLCRTDSNVSDWSANISYSKSD